jgi:hypothetical protein
MHVHRVNEVILAHGSGQFRLGDSNRSIDDGAVVFVPAGVPHGLHNDGDRPLSLQAVFPTTSVWIRYIERNPAPGTEPDLPQVGATYDFRTGEMAFDAS